MTNEEAIYFLNDIKEPDMFPVTKEEYKEALEMAVKALEKQIPKKAIEAKNIYPPEQFECPVCGGCVGRHKTLKKINDIVGEILMDCKVEYAYCLECGQRIWWG